MDELNDKNENISKFIDLLGDDDNNEEFINYFIKPENEIWNYTSNEDKKCILHILIEKNLFELLKQVIDITKQNTNIEIFNNFINMKDSKGRTPFHYACCIGNMKIIKYLLNIGVEYNNKADNGLSCLHFSAIKNKVTPIYYMIKKYNMNIDEKDNNGNTFFHCACFYSSETVINFFLNDKNLNINIPNNLGFIPLHFYITSRSSNYLKRLILYGADPYIKNKEGKNSFDIVNEKYEDNDKKKYIFEILRRKNFNKFQYLIFMFYHVIFIFLILLFEFPFIDKKYLLLCFLVWIFFIWSLILYFISVDSGTFKKNSGNYLLSLIDEDKDNNLNLSKYCIKCQIRKELYTKHCIYCDRCIKEFDHHCKWLEKCIGKNNKILFNVLIIFLLINSYVYFIPFYFALKSERIVYMETVLKFFFLDNLNILLKFKKIIFYLYLLFLICINIIIIPLIKFCLEQNQKFNIFYNNRMYKTEYLIENSEIVNDEAVNLLEENK